MYAKFVFVMGLFLTNSLVFGTEEVFEHDISVGGGMFMMVRSTHSGSRPVDKDPKMDLRAAINKLRECWEQADYAEVSHVMVSDDFKENVHAVVSEISDSMSTFEISETGERSDLAYRKRNEFHSFYRKFNGDFKNNIPSFRVSRSMEPMLSSAREFRDAFC